MSLTADDAAPLTALEWSVQPWRERPRELWRPALAVALTWTAVLALALPTLPTMALGLAATLPVVAGLFPVRCRIDEQGVTRWIGPLPERRPWSALQRADWRPSGVLLSPFQRRHWLDATRALFLPVPGLDPGRVRGAVGERLRRHGL